MCIRDRDRMVRVIGGAQVLFPWAEVSYLTMFPRHVTPCCDSHMTEEDTWVMDSVRRDVDRDIGDMLGDSDDGVTVLEWWDMLGLESDMTVRETRRLGVVCDDGVHLNERANRCAAVSLCSRLGGDGTGEGYGPQAMHGGQRKKLRRM